MLAICSLIDFSSVRQYSYLFLFSASRSSLFSSICVCTSKKRSLITWHCGLVARLHLLFGAQSITGGSVGGAAVETGALHAGFNHRCKLSSSSSSSHPLLCGDSDACGG